jgi:phosphopantothenoylcysteine decarboxylase/phosphopantothenate--cysteine ligase
MDVPSPQSGGLTGSSGIFRDRHILVCITGGIAAYKSAVVVSRLVQSGGTVTVAMTEAASRFVGALTFEALSGRAVLTSPWEAVESHDPQHVSLARSVAAAVVAPCSMDCLARLATGRADDIVSLLIAAIDRRRAPVLLCPAMNEAMWNQPSTQRNLAQVREDGFVIVGPEEGWQACRTVGLGRMSEPEAILAALSESLRLGVSSRDA